LAVRIRGDVAEALALEPSEVTVTGDLNEGGALTLGLSDLMARDREHPFFFYAYAARFYTR
jgi:hypothetical protein